MPVEILILSGNRQGQRLVVNGQDFRAGADRDCELFFDPASDVGAKDCLVQFRLQDDGWWIVRSRGSDVRLNQQCVAGPLRIRSGDVVRMSNRGPDFSLSFVARATAASSPAANRPSMAAARPAFHAPVPGPLRTDADDAPVAPSRGATVPVETPSDAGQAPSSGTPAATPAPDRPSMSPAALSRLAIGVGGAIVLGVVLVPLILWMRAPVVVVEQRPTEPAKTTDAGPPPPVAEPGAAAVPGTKAPQAETAETKPSPPPAPLPPPKEETIDTEAIQKTVYLIQVQKGPAFYPFATCCAVGDNTVLTTAREAMQLARWRENPKDRFRFWVTNKAQRVHREVLDIRVHAVFATLADKPGDWIYYDLALLTVEGKLPHVARVSSAAEARLEDGLHLTCCGFIHSGDKISRSDKLEPALTEGKVFLITHKSDLPADPRLLHVKAKFGNLDPPNAFGTPIFDNRGQVVAIYGEKSSPPKSAEGQVDLNIHYAPVVSSELIALWTAKHDEKIWIAPPLGQPASESPAER